MVKMFSNKNCKLNFNNVESIGLQAFYACKNIFEIDFGNVQTIEKEAFAGCSSLIQITFHNIQRIGNNAFYSSTEKSLVRVYILNESFENPSLTETDRLKSILNPDFKVFVTPELVDQVIGFKIFKDNPSIFAYGDIVGEN